MKVYSQLEKAQWENLSSAPTPTSRALHYYDTTLGCLRMHNGTQWINVTRAAPVTKTTTYTATSSDDTILADATSGAFAITLPTAVSIAGKRYTIKKIDSTVSGVTLTPNGSETIDGSTSQVLQDQNEVMNIESDGTNWRIV